MTETNILFPIPHGGRNADDMGLPAKVKTEHDVEFTHNQTRYSTDADTFRILFEALGTAFEAPIILAGLQNGKIKEVICK